MKNEYSGPSPSYVGLGKSAPWDLGARRGADSNRQQQAPKPNKRDSRSREHCPAFGSRELGNPQINFAHWDDRKCCQKNHGHASHLSIGTNGKERNASISVAYCPERVLPSRILTELVNNDRCIGGVTTSCARQAQRFYKTFVPGACIATTARTAELVKLTENAFRDTNIAFANELSLICDRFGMNVREVIDLANRHPRVNVLRPGPGVGGHCIAVDPWFIIDSAPILRAL